MSEKNRKKRKEMCHGRLIIRVKNIPIINGRSSDLKMCFK